MENGMKEWLQKLEDKLEKVHETGVRTETKLDSVSGRTNELIAHVQQHDVRLDNAEKDISEIRGGLKMVYWLVGLGIAGAGAIGAILAAVVPAILK